MSFRECGHCSGLPDRIAHTLDGLGPTREARCLTIFNILDDVMECACFVRASPKFAATIERKIDSWIQEVIELHNPELTNKFQIYRDRWNNFIDRMTVVAL